MISMLIEQWLSFFKSSKAWQVICSLCIGLVGALLLSVFLTGLLPMGSIKGWLPWILGFNALLTGYSLLERTYDSRFRKKRLAAVIIGGIMAFLFCVVFNALSVYMTATKLVFWTDLIFLTAVGAVLGGAGGILSIKHRDLVRQTDQ